MANWQEALKAGLLGGVRGYGKGREQVMALELEKKKEEWRERLKQQMQTEYMQKQSEAFGTSGMVPKGARVGPTGTTYTYELPEEEGVLTPAQKRQKVLDTTKLFSTIRMNEVKRSNLQEAQEAAKNIPQGLGGKIKIGYLQKFVPDSPILEDWQKIKMVLTDAQLMNTANTKGAISDREMELFAQAAANDDINSVSRMKPVLRKLMNFLDAEEKAQKEAYFVNYGVEPAGLFQKRRPRQTSSKVQRANEIAQQNPDLSKEQIINMVNEEFGR